MYLIINSFFLLFITIVQCQHSIPNTNFETCLCDLKNSSCDVSCCCDKDCSIEDLRAFGCIPKANDQTKLVSSKSTIQSTCFKDLPIYKSNSPYIVQKKGDLVCIDHEQDIDNSTYQKLLDQKIVASAFLSRSINIDNSISLPAGTPTTLTSYQLGTSIFRYTTSTNLTSYYSLPIKLFNSQTCSGFQPITYLNSFTSTCNQPVNQQTCLNALDTTKYISGFCLITNPSTLATAPNYICCTGTGSSSSWMSPSTCSNALQNLNLIIYYINSNGIVGCSVTLTTTTASTNSTVLQTLTVSFVQNGTTTATTSRSGHPGYFNGAPVIAGVSNGSSITVSDFSVAQASTDGSCSTTSRRPIRFGQNVRSTCLFGSSASLTCPTISNSSNIFLPFNASNLYVAVEGDSDPSTVTGGSWIPVTFCTSEIGSSATAVCQTGSVPSSSVGQCYNRLDIQIAYANFGSVTNPQPIIGAVIFHYQRITITNTTTLPAPLLITESVTFQDISNPPATDGDRIPRPNIRVLGDFFYPFSLNRANNSLSFSWFLYLLSSLMFILIQIIL